MAKKPKQEEKAHATFGASSSERWLNCPGSIELSKKAPPPVTSKYAEEGTRAHACLEMVLNGWLSKKETFEKARKLFPTEMVEHAIAVFHYVTGMLYEKLDAAFLVETRVDASWFTTKGQFGTLDIAIADEFKRLTVIDFKYGAGTIVEPGGIDGRGNPQLVYYALGISKLFDHNFEDVELVVIQPRAYHHSGETTRSHVMSMTDLLAWIPVFQKGVEACQEASFTKSTSWLNGGSWCKYCPAAVICPELKNNALKDAAAVFSDDLVELSLPQSNSIQISNLGVTLDACDRLEAWIDSVRIHAHQVMESGGEIPGFKLVQKRSTRRWTDELEATREAQKFLGPMAFSKPKLLSPAQLEAAAKKSKKINDWIAARTTSTSSGTTIVRDTDRRSSVRKVDQIFGDLP